jgi:allantoinase
VNHDLLIRDVRLVRHDRGDTPRVDIAVSGDRIVSIGADLDPQGATKVVDGKGRLAFPGVVDAHQHWGIYNSLDVDAASESRACAQGGVTTALTYMRTGQYYLNKSGPYRDFMPEVLDLAADRSHVDYSFHLAPMMKSHIDEIPAMIEEFGITSFKVFMFYGGFGLHGASDDQSAFLMTPPGERYDIAHFEFVMRGVQAAREKFPELADQISLSLHCETPEIMRAYTELLNEQGTLTGLKGYSESRPPHSEGLAVSIASYLAHATGLPTINLLHLTSGAAMEAAMLMAEAFPHINFRREVTVGHLLVSYETAANMGGKVNPPLRSPEDVELLWDHLLAGNIDWVCSDHACCKDEMKFDQESPDDIRLTKSGFGGAEYLLPGLITEGTKRGLTYAQIAALTAHTPAQRFGLHNKGVLDVGFDADIVLVDPEVNWTVSAEASESLQEYTPFEGLEMSAQVQDVFLRGRQILDAGAVVGEPSGKMLHRPLAND